MNTMKILDKAKLAEFLKGLTPDFEVIVPLKEDENLLFGDLDAAKLEAAFTGRPLLPPKEYLFPQKEKLLAFTIKDGGEVKIEAHLDNVKRAIWGIRPCDLYGIKTLDSVFLPNYTDTYYQARRENTILMGLNCTEPCETGFCNSLQTGPFAADSFDLLFTNLADKFLVEIGSNKGEELIGKRANLFTEATDGDKRKAKELEEKCKQAFKYSFDAKMVNNGLAKAWDDALWTEESKTCILCGGCNFVCPTCYCFNIEDIATEQQQVSERMRYWDSCQFSGFTQMAAENTRRVQAERLRQRIYHKLYYIPIQYDGAIGCTGCGRCIDICPAEIDITNIMRRVTEK